MTRTGSTLTGFIAILLWSFLALLTVRATPVPPLQLTAICFTIGGITGLVWLAASGTLSRLKQVGWKIYAFGTAGLFGYHFLYFSALRMAPAAEAGLIAYLWPLLIVLFSGLLPGETLRKGHIIGGLSGFAGAALIVLAGGKGFQADAIAGYSLAFLCALTWAGYSVISRRLGTIPTESVAVFCLLTAGVSAIAHLQLETTAWPDTTSGWGACLLLGLGPVGLAFYVWDIGVKRGDIQLLGVASFAAPLLSTLILVVSGEAQFTIQLLLAAVLITLGAVLAARASTAKA
jgi:drug/metabolite transporter (DMT)-like permease